MVAARVQTWCKQRATCEALQHHVTRSGKAGQHSRVNGTSEANPAKSTLLPDKGNVAPMLSGWTNKTSFSFIFLQTPNLNFMFDASEGQDLNLYYIYSHQKPQVPGSEIRFNG